MKAKRFNLVVKGDVAFAYALDENGKRVAAIDAIPGKKYYCPCCGILMHRQTRGKLYILQSIREQHTGSLVAEN